VSRPAFHVTAPSGWINDPLGVTWHDGVYELFVQYNPEGTEWSPACQWGRLTSVDLVHWRWVGTAIAPQPGEVGCWSGSVVTVAGAPAILYTSVKEGSLDKGAIALATGAADWSHWTAGRVVLPGPPPDMEMSHFRDPFVLGAEGAWRMVVGGGLPDGRGVALQYSSADLRDWALDGVLAERSGSEIDPVWTGSVWECVQLFPVDASWVLLVSVWHAGRGYRQVCAVGDYDGRRFTPRRWQRFTATDAVYAGTAFADAAGRRCVVSWVHEPAAPGADWAGVLSLPVVLGRDGDRVLVAPHPDVDGLRTAVLADTVPADGDVLGPFEPFLDLQAELDGPARLTVGDLLTLDAGAEGLVLRRPGRPDERLPAAARIRLLLDAELAEVFAAGDAAVVRLDPATGAVPVTVAGQGVRRLTVWALSR
jgi:beta-fructofuranosidase